MYMSWCTGVCQIPDGVGFQPVDTKIQVTGQQCTVLVDGARPWFVFVSLCHTTDS